MNCLCVLFTKRSWLFRYEGSKQADCQLNIAGAQHRKTKSRKSRREKRQLHNFGEAATVDYSAPQWEQSRSTKGATADLIKWSANRFVSPAKPMSAWKFIDYRSISRKHLSRNHMVQKCNRTCWSSGRTVFSVPLSLLFMETHARKHTFGTLNRAVDLAASLAWHIWSRKQCCGIFGRGCKQNTVPFIEWIRRKRVVSQSTLRQTTIFATEA
jgi:hypothetical protein